RATIIEQGYLKGYLHNAETAGIFKVANTGNARAFTYQDEPLIRMRNTYILPGNLEPEEIIAETPSGLYLKGLGQSGQADANAEFMFGVDEAWLIEKGKLTRRVTGVTISGQAFAVLSSVDKVGCDLLLNSGAGYCGKHQPAKVDAGGPHLRCRLKVGGNR
ncbi:MAG TPA: TldD/PmbA family protein, partial [bacterium]|nr:TldD/PmbA family protein [bacterium]